MHAGHRWISDRVVHGDGRARDRRPRLLILCDFRPREASTVIDHIEAIRKWSRYDVFVLPIFGDLPDELDLQAFDGLVIHYNLVMTNAAYLAPMARWAVSQFRGVKAAFIQDEFRFVHATVSVMRTLGINLLFTCVPEDQVELVYPREALPEMKRTVTVLTGYVPEGLLSLPVLAYEDRTVDVSYRGRRLPPWLGRLAQEKAVIADRFGADAPAYGLSVDISTREADRLYGQEWVEFVGRSKAILGVESGASVFDFDGSIAQAVDDYVSAHPDATFEELHRMFLAEVDGRIRLNQISPRCFEAAALRTLMVLYPGDYSGILRPWRHYVPLQKDHSNMVEVAHAIRDRPTWERITAQARDEVALNPRYSFKAMVETVDDALDLAGTAPGAVDPIAFQRTASESFARLDALHLRARRPLAPIDRARVAARRAARGLMPKQVEDVRRLRDRLRSAQRLTHWALRPRLLPWTLLARDRRLLGELSLLGRLQACGARAIGAGRGSPYAILVDKSTGDLRVVLRPGAAASAVPVSALPDDLSWASSVHLDIPDRWLVPPGTPTGQPASLDAMSRVVRARPEVVRRLLAGPAPWCDVLLKTASVPAPPIGKAERP